VSELELRGDRPLQTEEGERYVVVRIGAQWYATPVFEVREIVKLPPVTEVPGAGRGVRGVVLIHGAVVTLLDPRPLLGEAPAVEDGRTRALTVDHEGERLAVQVDEVARILLIPHASVELAHELPHATGAHVYGVARSIGLSPSGFVILLEVGSLVGAVLRPSAPFS
jgi:purine-binding chemotaxis protein CheW